MQGMIEFNGEFIKYPNGCVIYINYDEDDYSYTFDVFNENGDELCASMCLIHQAHKVAMDGKR